MSERLPLRTRHFRKIYDLTSETERDIPEKGMRRRAVAMTFLQANVAFPEQPSLVPSADGALQEIIFTIPFYVLEGENNPLWQVYQDLLLQLPAYTRLHLMVHEQVAEEVTAWLREQGLEQRAQVHPIGKNYGLFVWAQDDYEIVTDRSTGKKYLVQPHSNRRAADSLIGYLTANALQLERVAAPLYFEGGNLLVGDDFFLIGVDYAVDTLLHLEGTLPPAKGAFASEAVTRLFRQYLDQGRKLLFVGTTIYVPEEHEKKFKLNGEEWTEYFHTKNKAGTLQPLFHIDMFISLAGRGSDGRYILLVGDTRMAADILGKELLPYTAPDTLDDIANFLETQGFHVIRNPLPVTYVDNKQDKIRKWYFASSNNALVEIKAGSDKTVWLPTYGHGNWPELKKTDDANKKIWEELGFKVNQLTDFHPFAENSGAVHCITKYCSRG